MMDNGFGPWWFPTSLRAVLTRISALFFDEASWRIHDDSYATASPARSVCDRGFLCAMIRDASLQKHTLKIAACCVFAWMIWISVRLFGWLSYGRNK